ncbi:alginate lyase family protein [Caulobacter segnis]|uniref:Alginate lyase n=1 Tax=Caulobacter segnis TaxID=88688 RepID=A0A2W5UYH3_9CAUL|nr:alginate lyase family protein [Caulobacter segnis]PZR32849.1 MAG: alginate lyase [Caulobacter segnis]
MVRYLFVGVIVAVTAGVAHAQDFGLLDGRFVAALPDLRERPAAAEVIRRADAGLEREPGPLPVVHTEGTLPGTGIREESTKAREDLPIMLNLALAYRMTGQRPYLQSAERFMTAWTDVYKISLNPIDETHFDQVIMACDLVCSEMTAAARDKIRRFTRAMAEGYLDAMDKPRDKPETNWQSHRVKLAVMAAFQSGDKKLIARARDAYDRQIAANINADGTVFDFHERDALHYVTYDLDPLMMAALSAKAHGQDWFERKSAAGSSLPGALDWLTPYALGEKTHQEFVRSKIVFDAQRAAAGQAEYQPHPWDRANGVQTFALAAQLSPRYAPVFKTVATETRKPLAPWLALFVASR